MRIVLVNRQAKAVKRELFTMVEEFHDLWEGNVRVDRAAACKVTISKPPDLRLPVQRLVRRWLLRRNIS